MDISVIYEDADILVIDKPAGITVNKADTTRYQMTVQEWAENYFYANHFEFVIEQGDFYKRGGIVHRLDKETSGVLLLAKNPFSFLELQKLFKERLVSKTYLALAHGKVTPREGEISLPVGRLPWNRMQFGIVPGGRESLTLYKMIREYRDDNGEVFSYLELFPKTGRTHQIRVHLKYLGNPIFGDFLYAGRKTARSDRSKIGRFFLHANKLSFVHPKLGKELTFESKLPVELELILNQLEMVEFE
jgi:23S rRNA pseudouridine1911/1915/1917 synthase